MGKCPDALMADFQQFYGLNTEDFGVSISLRRAAALAAQLPKQSRCLAYEDPDFTWDDLTYFVSNIEYLLRIQNYSYSKDAKYGTHKPKPNLKPSERKSYEEKIAKATPEETALKLGIKL